MFRFNRGLLQGAIEHMGGSPGGHGAQLVAWNRRYDELFSYPPGLIQVGRSIEEIIRYNAGQGLRGGGHRGPGGASGRLQAGSPHVSARERPMAG
jgi:hypothetical protein